LNLITRRRHATCRQAYQALEMHMRLKSIPCISIPSRALAVVVVVVDFVVFVVVNVDVIVVVVVVLVIDTS
jgi:hypothetical protein